MATTHESPQGFADVGPNHMTPQGRASVDIADAHRFNEPAVDLAAWLERHAPCWIEVQKLRRGARPKNRVILTFEPRPGETRSIGAPSVRAVIFRASVREQIQAAVNSAAKENHETSDVG